MAGYRSRMENHMHTGWHEFLHLLYDPFAFGRKSYRVRVGWLHRIHLIPGTVLDRSCSKCDQQLEV